jgi:hypothetical protein
LVTQTLKGQTPLKLESTFYLPDQWKLQEILLLGVVICEFSWWKNGLDILENLEECQN